MQFQLVFIIFVRKVQTVGCVIFMKQGLMKMDSGNGVAAVVTEVTAAICFDKERC